MVTTDITPYWIGALFNYYSLWLVWYVLLNFTLQWLPQISLLIGLDWILILTGVAFSLHEATLPGTQWTCTHTHTHTHTYIHTYIHTYTHTQCHTQSVNQFTFPSLPWRWALAIQWPFALQSWLLASKPPPPPINSECSTSKAFKVETFWVYTLPVVYFTHLIDLHSCDDAAMNLYSIIETVLPESVGFCVQPHSSLHSMLDTSQIK